MHPSILFFFLGVLIGFLKEKPLFSKDLMHFLSLYLMLTIGFKGGAKFTPDFSILPGLFAGIALGFIIPFISYFCLHYTTKLDPVTKAAVSAHYGSVSIMTFVAATTFLESYGIPYASYMTGLVALMEMPAIVSGLFLGHRHSPSGLIKKVLCNEAILLLLGAFIIGMLTGTTGLEKVSGFFILPFQGIVCLFLLGMGVTVSQNQVALRNFSWSLGCFGIYMPLIGAVLGLSASYFLHFDLGTGMLFTVLCSSCSYIAVPAAMRFALPDANASLYLPLALGITFPFNILIGIPLYYYFSKILFS